MLSGENIDIAPYCEPTALINFAQNIEQTQYSNCLKVLQPTESTFVRSLATWWCSVIDISCLKKYVIFGPDLISVV